MATIEDVVAQLVKRTESGDLKWKPFYVGSGTTPFNWQVANGGCRFTVNTGAGTELILASETGVGSHTIGKGKQISSLIEVLQTKFGGKSMTHDEALAIALDCLTKQSQ